MCICHPKILNVIFLFIVFVLLFFCLYSRWEKTHRQLFICSILGIFVCILVVEKTIVADICSLLVCSYFAPKILAVIFYFFVFILLFFCLYSSWQKQRYKIVVTGLNACTGPITTNAIFLAELQQGQKFPGLIARPPNRLFDGCVIVTLGPDNSRKETQKLARIRTTWMKNHWLSHPGKFTK